MSETDRQRDKERQRQTDRDRESFQTRMTASVLKQGPNT